MLATGTAVQPGIIFPPTASGKTYLSAYHHRGHGNHSRKSEWVSTVSPQMEYGIFCSSDAGAWKGCEGDFWGLHGGAKTVLGKSGERLCRFPAPTNRQDPWHGYPVSPMESLSDRPCDDLVRHWHRTGIIDRVVAQKIMKAKI